MQGIVNLVKALKKRGVALYLISGSFRELIMPVAKYLGVPKENVFANRMDWCVCVILLCVCSECKNACKQESCYLLNYYAKYLGVPKENVFANRMDWCVCV